MNVYNVKNARTKQTSRMHIHWSISVLPRSSENNQFCELIRNIIKTKHFLTKIRI